MVGLRTLSLPMRVLLLAAALPASTAAQTVRGRVLDAATRAPITGAHVLLLDAAGQRQASVLTSATGAFQLGATGPGRWGVRVEMIGRRTLDADPVVIAAGETVDLVLELAHAPIALESLDVRSAQKCEVRPETGALTQTVWEEARKALSIEAAVRAQGIYRFSIERYVRELDPDRRRVRSQDVQTVARYTGQPFHSKPVEELITAGFFESRADGDWLYGPNGEVLLSDAFLDTHCFFLRRDGDRPDQIGLAFEPVRDRRIADIEGTLWLNEQTATLAELEFTYVNLPSSLPPGPRGGRAEFLQLPDGAFIVRAWSIWSPRVEISRSRFNNELVGDERIVGIHEDGGEVLRIEDRRGATIREATRGVLVGEVWDSIAGEPLVGAQVFLVDTNIGATTGSTGRYRIPNLSPGIYRVSFRHDKLEQLGFTPQPIEVDVRPGEMNLTFVLPKAAEITATTQNTALQDSIAAVGRVLGIDWSARLDRRNSGAGLPARDAAHVFGTVLDHGTGDPVPEVVVTLENTDRTALTDARGRFRFESVPAGAYQLTAQHVAYGLQKNPIEVKAGRSLDITLRLAVSAVALDTIAVEVAERSPWLVTQGFYLRRDQGGIGGHFILGEELERRATDFITDVLDNLPGVRIDYDLGPGKRSVRFNRPGNARADGWCEPDLFVDGALYRNSSAPLVSSGGRVSFGANPNRVDDFNVVPPSNIAAIEVYVGAAVPPQFGGSTSGCGAIVYWLKR